MIVSRTNITALTCIILLGACTQQTATPEAHISDVALGALAITETSGFHWLPPIRPVLPSYPGVFDPNQQVEVRICPLDRKALNCNAADIVTFTTADDTVITDTTLQEYTATFNSAQSSLSTNVHYRVRVLAGTHQLGSADIDVVRNEREASRVNTSAFVPLVNGSTLNIKFKIQRQAPPSGSLDTTFGGDGRVETSPLGNGGGANDVVVQADGKLVAAGVAFADPDALSVVRYLPNGTLDPSFGTQGIYVDRLGARAQANAVGVQNDGKLVVAGYRIGDPATAMHMDMFLLRLNPDGTLDSTFGTNGVVVTSLNLTSHPCGCWSSDPATSTEQIHALQIQADGRIMVGGEVNGPTLLARYNANGVLDPTFGNGGYQVYPDQNLHRGRVEDLTVLSDGKIVTSGGSGGQFYVQRFLPDGSLDPQFGTANTGAVLVNHLINHALGVNNVSFGRSISVQPDGKYVAFGYSFNVFDMSVDHGVALARLNPDGTTDETFGTSGAVLTPFFSAGGESEGDMTVLPDGRIAVAATVLERVNSVVKYYFGVAMYLPHGTLDTSFNTSGKAVVYIGDRAVQADALVQQTDGRVVVAGRGTQGGGNNNFLLTRLWP